MLTSCPRSQQLRWHCVREVNNYADIVSKKSTTTLTPCPRSQQLRWHRVREVNNYADTVSEKSTTTLTPCPRSQQLRWHRVRDVNNFTYTPSPRIQQKSGQKNFICAKSKIFAELFLHVQKGGTGRMFWTNEKGSTLHFWQFCLRWYKKGLIFAGNLAILSLFSKPANRKICVTGGVYRYYR